MGGLPFRFTTVFLALLGLALLVLAALNVAQERTFELPDDGVSWVDSRGGAQAWIVARGGPGERAGIREGDTLASIDGIPAQRSVDAAREVFRKRVWSEANYELLRQGERFQTKVVIAAQRGAGALRHYLRFMGLVYGIIAAFVLARRRSASAALHLYAFCLASFALYTLAYTGKLDPLDWTVYWLNVLALILQPAIFLHFCLTCTESQEAPRSGYYTCLLLYLPGTFLLLLHTAVALEIVTVPLPLPALRWVLDRLELVYWVSYFLTGAVYLGLGCRRARAPMLRSQLKLLARGAFLAVSPFALFYALPYLLGFVPTPWMEHSVAFLILLPLTIAYAMLRWSPREARRLPEAVECAS